MKKIIYNGDRELAGVLKDLPLEKADAAIFGAPTDHASGYRPGARWGPQAVREASCWMSDFCTQKGEYLRDKLSLVDEGDIDADTDKLVEIDRRIGSKANQIIKAGAMPVLLGGDHSVTFPAVKAVGETGLIYFDAHPDLLTKAHGERYSHACVLRRILELGTVKPENVVIVGLRSPEPPEFQYLKQNKIKFFTALEVEDIGAEKAVRSALKAATKNVKQLYVSIDMDCLDPAFAPAVENPSPGGLSTRDLIRACRILGPKVSAFDVVEVAPIYETGSITAKAAARFVLEMLSAKFA